MGLVVVEVMRVLSSFSDAYVNEEAASAPLKPRNGMFKPSPWETPQDWAEGLDRTMEVSL